MPGLITPAFSPAISAIVRPRNCSWSKSIDVMAAADGVATFVASRRPPMPTSRTATSTRARLKISNPIAVATSKNVGSVASVPAARSRCTTASTSLAVARSTSVSTGRPSMANRSSRRTRCGEV